MPSPRSAFSRTETAQGLADLNPSTDLRLVSGRMFGTASVEVRSCVDLGGQLPLSTSASTTAGHEGDGENLGSKVPCLSNT